MTMMMHGIQLTQQAPTGQENSLPTPMDGFVDSLMRWSFITDQPLIIDSDVVVKVRFLRNFPTLKIITDLNSIER